MLQTRRAAARLHRQFRQVAGVGAPPPRPAMPGTETEIKCHLKVEDLAKLKAHLAASGLRAAHVLRQTSHFFDVGAGVLDKEGVSFRLRRVEHIAPESVGCDGEGVGGAPPQVVKETWEVTVKGKGVELASGWCKPEEEVSISVAEGLRLLADPGTPGAAGNLFDAFPAPKPALVRECEALCAAAGGALAHQDQFVNLRCKYAPFVVPAPAGPEATALEVDRTTFSHAGASLTDAEVECELSSPAVMPAATAALHAVVVKACGYEPWPAVGKRKRCRLFAAAVKARM